MVDLPVGSDAVALVAWLKDQITEDERIARRVLRYSWELREQGRWESWEARRHVNNDAPPYFDFWAVETKLGGLHPKRIVQAGDQLDAEYIAAFDPARVLREVAAKRELLNYFDGELADDAESVMDNHLVRVMAEIYQDRSGFRVEWRAQ